MLTDDRRFLFQFQEICIYLLFTKRGKSKKICIRPSTWTAMKLVFSYFLIVTKSYSKHKLKQNKIRNMKVGNTFFSHCMTRQVSVLAQAVLSCNLFWKIFHDKQDYRSMNKRAIYFASHNIFFYELCIDADPF